MELFLGNNISSKARFEHAGNVERQACEKPVIEGFYCVKVRLHFQTREFGAYTPGTAL